MYFSVPHRRVPAPVRERMREPDHLRDNERAVSRRIRSRPVLPSVAALRAHQRCVSIHTRSGLPARQERKDNRLVWQILRLALLDGGGFRVCVVAFNVVHL